MQKRAIKLMLELSYYFIILFIAATINSMLHFLSMLSIQVAVLDQLLLNSVVERSRHRHQIINHEFETPWLHTLSPMPTLRLLVHTRQLERRVLYYFHQLREDKQRAMDGELI